MAHFHRVLSGRIIGTLATGAVVAVSVLLPNRPIALAVAVWCAGPLPVLAQDTQWLKLHPAIAAFHAAGWQGC